MRANGIAEYSRVGRTLQWIWPGLGTNRFSVPDVGLDERDDAALFNGYKQKIADAAAKKDATHREKFEAQAACIETLESGSWNKGERGAPSFLAEAIAQVKGKPVSEIRKILAGADPKKVRAMAAKPEYAGVIAEIRASRVRPADVADVEAEIDAL